MTEPDYYDPTFETTTELPHRHYCDLCGGTWEHCDDLCEGPRLGRIWCTPGFDCPMCVDRGTDL